MGDSIHRDPGVTARTFRSESVQNEKGRREVRANPRPSLMQHWVNPGQASVDEARWRKGAEEMRESGRYDGDTD